MNMNSSTGNSNDNNKNNSQSKTNYVSNGIWYNRQARAPEG